MLTQDEMHQRSESHMSDRMDYPKHRILITGDSLAVPRPHRGQRLEVTWPVLLKSKFPELDIWQRCRAGSMSDAVLKEYNLFSDSIDAFRALVIQVGIGDCCPRPYPLFIQQFIMTYELNGLHKWLNAKYPTLLKFRSKPWISKERFTTNVKFMIDTTRERNPSATIFVIKIGTPCHDFVKKVANIPEYAAAYNDSLASLCSSYRGGSSVHFIDPYEGHKPEDLFIADGHHLTVLGHEVVAASLEDHFAKIAAEPVACKSPS